MSNSENPKPKRKTKNYDTGRKTHTTLEEGRKPGSGTNPNSWTLPRKLTPELMDTIVDDISYGLTIERAFQHVGLHPQTWYDWRAKAEGGDEEAQWFVSRVEASDADFELQALKNIAGHAKKVWVADAWRLERRYQDRYALQNKINATLEVSSVTAKDAIQAQAHAISSDVRILELSKQAALENNPSDEVIDVTPVEEHVES